MAAKANPHPTLSFETTREFREHIEAAASARNLSVSDYIETALREALASHTGPNVPLEPRLTHEERERGLRALDNLERLDRELMDKRAGVPFPPSWEVINEMRDQRTRELMQQS